MLLLVIFLFPILGSLVLSLIKVSYTLLIKVLSLFFVTVPLLLSIIACIGFDYNGNFSSYFQFVSYPIRNIGIGVDGISLLFILLTTFLFSICVLFDCCKTGYTPLNSYMALFLLLEGFLIGFFISLNSMVLYVFFEAVLIPMFFIIGIWGGKRKIYAAFKFFLYTLVGSLLFFIGLIYLYNVFETFDIEKLIRLVPNLNFDVQLLLWVAFFISFAIKVPMLPFHTWLPDVHVQSPTSGSVILASLLIKMGGYGFLRFSIFMLPEASFYFSDFVILLSILAVIYASFIAFAQENMKSLVAYSSIAHMGIVTAGLFSFYEEGIIGAIFQMISHAVISAALFLCVGIFYSRTGTLKIGKYAGMMNTMSKFSFMFILFSMASIGLPGMSGFIGEFLSIIGVFKKVGLFAGFLVFAIILSAVYMLNLCKKTIWGVSYCFKTLNITLDIDIIEFSILLLLAIITISLGFYPNFILNYLKPCIESLLLNNSSNI